MENSKEINNVDEKVPNSQLNRASIDPKVGCPIVCGQEKRASGFFFATDDETYLITARHNVLPTDGQKLVDGELRSAFRTTDYLPFIDVYLRTPDGFDVARLDIREIEGVKKSSKIDVVGIPFSSDPEKYGYNVWTADDVSPPEESTEILNIIGFDGTAFPSRNREYDITMYCNEIGRPATLEVTSNMAKIGDVPKSGLMGFGKDEQIVGDNESYTGLSGAPVLGDDLVGIHSYNSKPPSEALEKYRGDDFMWLMYSRAEILPKLLG
jgi:hypothetical protein